MVPPGKDFQQLVRGCFHPYPKPSLSALWLWLQYPLLSHHRYNHRSCSEIYVKLPDSFYIATPVGHYNPDWAIAFYEGTVKHIYFVAETKGSMSSMQLRLIEESKIHCAREHFKAISSGNVVYDVVDSYQTLLERVMK